MYRVHIVRLTNPNFHNPENHDFRYDPLRLQYRLQLNDILLPQQKENESNPLV